ncbi:hypothetical protein [Clostridium tetanomorphum]|nr:hypothetical protein [Clostridium tetanomorphum]
MDKDVKVALLKEELEELKEALNINLVIIIWIILKFKQGLKLLKI